MNLSMPYEDWYCCLNPREQNALTACVIAFGSNPLYITQVNYSIIAFTTGLAGLSILNQYFVDHYGLTEGIALDGEGNPIEVFYFDTEFWTLFALFAISPAFACPEPCAAFEFWT